MREKAIQIQNISKKYRLRSGRSRETFYALKDINLEIPRGEVFGLIGPNGAGKSTLLKVLARITKPTSGTAIVKGRMASLLEVGTGFHPELSGRENIFLNGAVLGMTRQEIRQQFDEIVAFSGIGKFIDTPVKHYSNGMYVRLAFSVASHLNADILLIDEVLAVGDAEFQRKCLDKMSDATREQNRTVIFVSHNMAIARSLCQTIAYLDHGVISKVGSSEEITNYYLSSMQNLADEVALEQRRDRQGNGEGIITNISIKNAGTDKNMAITGEEAEIEIEYQLKDAHTVPTLDFYVNIVNSYGNFLTTLSNHFKGVPFKSGQKQGKVICKIPSLPLMEGHYYFTVQLFVNTILADSVIRATNFEVLAGDYFKSGIFYTRDIPGLFIDHTWENKKPI